jgi:hypothetical protein
LTAKSGVATVEVPFEALVRELGAKRAIKFISVRLGEPMETRLSN